MKQQRKILSIFFLFGICFAIVQGQETIPATGGNASGSGGSVSYTVGQIAYSALFGPSGAVTQGVQQPFEITVITSIPESIKIVLDITVFPNPSTDFVKLKIENYNVDNLRYQLYDNNGSILRDNKVEDNETNIIMKTLVPAIYFLKVTDNNKVVKTFKIIKH
jgi:hypothetical protein